MPLTAHTIRPRRIVAVVAAALAVFAGSFDTFQGTAPPRPAQPSAIEPCVTGTGVLLADLDADGHRDRAFDPSGTGARLTITFGTPSGDGRRVGVRELVGGTGHGKEDRLAVVADFDRDGWADLLVTATGPWRGDDPIEPRLSELRRGPFSRTGRGHAPRHVGLGETRGLAVGDYNHDRYPDLAAFIYNGDGVYATHGLLGEKAAGIGSYTGKYAVDAEQTDDDTPDNMPTDGLSSFYPRCAGE
ncbi:FG-GAP repeat domain-containing protein [Streptomyces sp. NPDC001843]|uniref:FG-GAP repeat domain-containing protein n=1 Tax=Streptomyces sp. NPDC001843 TaxID=3364617 RepID=UPI0036B9BE82